MRINLTTILFILLIASLIGCFFLYQQLDKTNQQLTYSTQNMDYLKDSLRVSRNKNNQLTYSKSVLVGDKRTLEDHNKELHDQLSKARGKILTLTHAKIKYKDTTTHKGTITPMNNNRFQFDFDTKDISIEGYLNNHPTNPLIYMTRLKYQMNITQGIRLKDDKLEVFAWTNNQGKITELNSILLNPQDNPVLKQLHKRNRFHVSLYVGYGLTLHQQRVYNGPQVGIGGSLTLF